MNTPYYRNPNTGPYTSEVLGLRLSLLSKSPLLYLLSLVALAACGGTGEPLGPCLRKAPLSCPPVNVLPYYPEGRSVLVWDKNRRHRYSKNPITGTASRIFPVINAHRVSNGEEIGPENVEETSPEKELPGHLLRIAGVCLPFPKGTERGSPSSLLGLTPCTILPLPLPQHIVPSSPYIPYL